VSYSNKYSRYCGLLLLIGTTVVAQVPGGMERRVRIGSLQSQFTACGFERAFTGTEYVGVKWPADYPYQDNAVIERTWVACQNFTDQKGSNWEKYGVYFDEATVSSSVFPVVHEQITRFAPPKVFVDGIDITSPYAGDIDRVDETIIPDRIINNVVNTAIGLTVRRKVHVFSQQYHDNYFIKEYTFTNTGNTDYDDARELNAPLLGVRFGWSTRYSTCREGAAFYDNQQSWGKFSWVTKRGENYAQYASQSLTETNGLVDWLRCGITWGGQSDRRPDWDNIGAPDIDHDGRLGSPQFVAVGILHVDQSATNHSDNVNQPFLLGWHASDAVIGISDQLGQQDPVGQRRLYDFLTGTAYPTAGNGGTDRFWETYTGGNILDKKSPFTIHNDVGGTSIWCSYGPFDLQPGDSVKIVEVEAVNGISRTKCEEIGRRWLRAYKNSADTGPFTLPNGTTTNNKDEYKNKWFYTGMDSILLTVSRAKRCYDLQYQIPQPPLPPPKFEVNSGGDRISLSWSPSPSESEAGFVGYKIFRAIGKPDTIFQEIFNCPKGIYAYDDVTPVRGFAYYYYLLAYNDGTNNSAGVANPTGALYSSRFYTKTTEPAYLRRQMGRALKDIRVVPNPFNAKASNMQFADEQNKIMFYNIPGQCVIKIYTERGDLIQTLKHTNGSGDHAWNSLTSSRQTVASGIYIAYIEVTEDIRDMNTNELIWKKGESTTRKILVVR